MADRVQDGPGVPAREPVPGRPGAGPPARGAGLRPIRPDRAVRPARREGRRDRDPASSAATLRRARTAAGAIRGLSWLTGCEAGLGQPSAAYDVIGALALAASRLHQALAQITGWLDRALEAGRLGHDLGEDPAGA